MKRIVTVATLIIISAVSALAQTSAEKEVLKFIADYDQAYINQDLTWMERSWADDYIFSADDGSVQNREEALAYARKDFGDTNSKFKVLSLKSVNDSMHINENMAVVSGKK